MALKITEDCISCAVCVDECPNQAIVEEDMGLMIKPELCTECIVDFDTPQCQDLCPSDAIVKDPDHEESEEELKAKREALKA